MRKFAACAAIAVAALAGAGCYPNPARSGPSCAALGCPGNPPDPIQGCASGEPPVLGLCP